MRQSHLMLSNAAVIWMTQALQLVPQLVLVPYLIGTIGDAGYGVYALVWSLMVSIEQLQASLQQGVVKYSAGFLARGCVEEVNGVVSSSFVYSIALAFVACACMLAGAVFYKDPSGQIRSALAVVGVMVLFIAPLTPYIAVIQSRQRYYVEAVIGTVSKYASLVAIVIWFSMVKPSVEAVIVIMAVALFLARLAQVPIAYRLVPGLQNRLGLCNRKHLKLIVSFGGMVVLIGLCLTVNSAGIRWLMNSLASTSFVAHLAIMLMPSILLSQIVTAATITVMPATSAYAATGNQQMLQELLIYSMRYTMVLVLAALLIAVLLMRNVLNMWVGAEYVFLTPYALLLFAGHSFMLSTSAGHHMLKGLGWLWSTVFISMMGLVVVPIGLMWGVFSSRHNPYLAATAGLVAGNVVYGYLQIMFSSKAVHASLRRILLRVYVQPLVVAAATALVAFGLAIVFGFDSFLARALMSVLAVLLLFGGCYALITTIDERRQIKAYISMAIDRFG